MPVLEPRVVLEREQKRFPFLTKLPFFAKRRNQIAVLVGGQQSLENVCQDLLLFE